MWKLNFNQWKKKQICPHFKLQLSNSHPQNYHATKSTFEISLCYWCIFALISAIKMVIENFFVDCHCLPLQCSASLSIHHNEFHSARAHLQVFRIWQSKGRTECWWWWYIEWHDQDSNSPPAFISNTILFFFYNPFFFL